MGSVELVLEITNKKCSTVRLSGPEISIDWQTVKPQILLKTLI